MLRFPHLSIKDDEGFLHNTVVRTKLAYVKSLEEFLAYNIDYRYVSYYYCQDFTIILLNQYLSRSKWMQLPENFLREGIHQSLV